MLIYLLYDAWQIDYGPKPESPVVQEMTQDLKEDLPTATGEPQPEANNAIVRKAPEEPDTVISVTTDVLALEIDPKGGTIRKLDLLKYPREKENTVVEWVWNLFGFSKPEKDLSPIRLFNSQEEKLFLAQSGLISSEGSANAPTHHSVFSFEKDQYLLADDQKTLTVPLTWTDNQGLTVTKALTFKRGSYVIEVDHIVSNDSDQPWSGRQYKQLLRVPHQEEAGHTFIRTYTGGVLYTDESKYQKISFDDMASDKLNVTTTGGWSAMIQHYFAAAWVPPKDQENTFYTKDLKDWRYVIGSYSPAFTVEPNSELKFNAVLFAGPKIQPMMEEIAKGLELTVDYAWLTIIAKPIYWLLNQIHGFVGNWGLSIIGVTLCIKLLFFKLSQASFHSMAKMRKIQPRLKELQERFADDRQRFNKEMMDMYKREKVNPLGGCLPILVQIPVFISLYWVLVETVELRQAPFALWIQDLSAQDPFFILPILMGITMKIQQSLNPAPIDPLQAKIMKMFPIVFTVFFLFFPAGLVLYWVVNNTLSIIQQWYITKNMEDAHK